MANLIDLNLDPDERTLRQFGFISLAGFGAIAALAWFEKLVFAGGLGEARPWVAGICLAIGAFATLTSLVYPKANKPLFIGLSVLAFPIGFVVSHVILGTLYYIVISPIGFLVRTFGHDPMQRGFENADTYWTDCRPERPQESYFKQF
jgi:hypothetical protein